MNFCERMPFGPETFKVDPRVSVPRITISVMVRDL